MVARGETGSVGRKHWELWISRCILLHIEWIGKKVLLYSTENCISYLIISYSGKEYEKECTYICVCVHITESLCHIAETNTILQINHTSVK